MEVTVRTDTRFLKLQTSELDAAVLVASAFGYDLDMEPGEPGKAKLTATHRTTGAKVTANGNSPMRAAARLIDLLTPAAPTDGG